MQGKFLYPFILFSVSLVSQAEPTPTAADLILLDFEELVNMDVEISSAGKQKSRALDLPYAAYVLSSAEIENSGAQNLPDALRLIPGVNIGQISASEWSLSIRGAGGRFSRFVLFMVDGRIAHNTVFSGVNLDEMNYPVDSIERIEVVRGPNASAWGANAVNGIIHIITKRGSKNAASISAWAGTDERYGTSAQIEKNFGNSWALSSNLHGVRRDGLEYADSDKQEENTSNWRFSSNLFNKSERSETLVTADIFGIELSPPFAVVTTQPLGVAAGDTHEQKSGWAFLAEHGRALSDNYNVRVRNTCDRVERDSNLYFWKETNYQLDLELDVKLPFQQITTGINFKNNDSTLIRRGSFSLNPDPESRNISNLGIYISDIISITENFETTVSVRWDDNELSTQNTQPSLRFLWRPTETSSVWFAASKATTTPSRLLIDIAASPISLIPPQGETQPLPLVLMITGSDEDRKDTSVKALELGWRRTFSKFNLEVSLFNFNFENEVKLSPADEIYPVLDEVFQPIYLVQPMMFTYTEKFSSQGGEISTRAKPSNRWSTQLSYSGRRIFEDGNDGQWSSNITWTNSIAITPKFLFNLAIRHSQGDAADTSRLLAAKTVDNYVVADINLTWQATQQWKTYLTFYNLGDKHVEAIREQFSDTEQYVEPYALIKTKFSF